MKSIAIITLLALLAGTAVASTDAIMIPRLLNYQGKLLDNLGMPVPDTLYNVTFGLYSVPTGGVALWSENQAVSTQAGLFSTLIGTSNPISALPDAGALYLGMKVGADPEMTPRTRVASSAYAFLAERAAGSDLLQGRDTSYFARATHNHDAAYVNEAQTDAVTSAMLVNGTIAAVDLNQMGATTNQVLKWTGAAWTPRNDSVGGGSGGDNDWLRSVPADSVLYTIRKMGIARGGSNNALYGNYKCTHVNLGIACTTGTAFEPNHDAPAIGGGYGNTAGNTFVSIGGGYTNKATGYATTIAGGYTNKASGTYYATVGGGRGNVAGGHSATVGGGSNDTASGDAATIAGGMNNKALGGGATVSGGSTNRATHDYSMIPGGYENGARGCGSFAAGMRAKANHDGCFVWNDSSIAPNDSLGTTADNQFRVRARGGVWFYSDQNRTLGVKLDPGSNSWSVACDSVNKTDFRAVDRRDLLKRVAALPVRSFQLRAQPADIRHIGPVAQDFHAAFGFGESNTAINLADADGVLLAAIQALYEQNRAQQAEIDALKARFDGQGGK